MRVTLNSTAARLCVALLTAAAVPTPPASACGKIYTEAQLSSSAYEMARKLDLLWTGTDDERLWIAADAWPHFRVFDMEEEAATPEELEAVAASLRLFVQIEPDDWVLTGVLRGLYAIESPMLDVVFADALRHPSANVREVAVRRFVRVRYPGATETLERIWNEESRPAIRINTMVALACQGSDRHVDAFAAALDSQDPEWVAAAIEVLSALRPGIGESALLRAARAEEWAVRGAALAALADFPDSYRARAALLRGLSDPEERVREVALGALDSFAGDDVTAALHDAALDGNWSVRNRAFHRLLEQDEGLSRDELLGRLRVDERFSEEYVQAWDVDPMEFHVPTVDERICPFWGRRDPELPDRAVLRAAPGRDTVRCHERPGVAAEPLWADRLPDGEVAWPHDAFEHGGERWVRSAGCWHPLRVLEEQRPGGDVERPGVDVGEFDLRREDLDDPQFAALREAGYLSLFDEADGVVGVRVVVDPHDAAAVEPLARAWEGSRTLLGVRLSPWLERLAARHPEHPVWERLGDIEARTDERTETLYEDFLERMPAYRKGH